MNGQFDRIKQLFTEERLYGNLVENNNDELLTEQEKQKKKYNRGVERAKRKLERKLKKSKSKEEMDKAQEKFAQKTSELWSDYSKNPKAFNTKKLLFKNGDLKLYGHKDKANDLMLVSLGKGVSAEEGSKNATNLIKSYFKEKLAKDNEDIEVTLISNDKFKSGNEYIVFSVIDNSDLIPSQENKSTDGPTEKPTGKPEEKTSEKPAEKVKSSVKQPEKSEGDFTKQLQKLGGAQEGYSYILTGKNNEGQLTAKKVDSGGKTIATYVRESKFNKKSLFESVYTFDVNNTITENWKWVEGDKTFSDSMSKKFDDAINQVSDDVKPDPTEEEKGGKDKWGRDPEDQWYGFDPEQKKFTIKDKWGRDPEDQWYGFDPETKKYTKGNKAKQGGEQKQDGEQKQGEQPKQGESYAEAKKWLAKEGKDFLVGDFAETFPKIYKEMETEANKDESFEDFSSTLDPVGVEEFTAVYKTLSKYDKEGVVPAFLKVYERVHDQLLIDDVDSEDADSKEEEDIKNKIMSLLDKYNDSWWEKLSNWFKNL